MEGLKNSKGPNIMGSHLMPILGFLIRELPAQHHCLLDPGRDGSRDNILMETIPEGHKNQIFTLTQVLGPVKVVTQGSYRTELICPPEETCSEMGPKLV